MAVQAKIKPNSPSSIWLIPLLAIVIGIWMVYHNWANQGPLITIEFSKASGIEVGSTKIKSLDVDIGQVTKVVIKPSLDGVIVTARLSSPDYEDLLREDTAFWVVSPQVTRAGVSGLHTLLSGPYIELYPGAKGEEVNHFQGLESAPLTAAGTPGLSVTLSSEYDFSFTSGDPVIYKGFNVGKIEDIYFNSDENKMYYNAFIEAPYHTLIRSNTRFWKMSGIEVDLSADGMKIKSGTMESVVRGGVTFGLPQDEVLGAQIEGRAYFDIYPDEQAILDDRYIHKVEYVLLVEDSIRGLQVGAPVEYRGVKVGKVVSTDLAYHQISNFLDKASLIPVLIELEPGRMGLSDDEGGVDKLKLDIEKWVATGLKASLITGNLVTGSQLVELQYAGEEEGALTEFNQYTVIPLIPNRFSRVGVEIGELVNKLNQLPVDTIASDVQSVLNETKNTLLKVQRLPLESLANNADVTMEKTHDLMNKLVRSVEALETVMLSAEQADLPNSMDKTLESVNTLILEAKPLIMNLKSHPNSLIFGGKTHDKVEPKKRKQ